MTLSGSGVCKLPGMDNIVRTELPNGMTVLCHSNPLSPSVALSGYISSGSLADPLGQEGLANAVSLMLLRGSADRTFQQIYDEMESAGINLGFSCSVHTTSFSGKALTEDAGLLLDLLSQSIRYPTFPSGHLEKVKAQLMTMFALHAQDTAEMASQECDRFLFPDHPYGRPEFGTPESVFKFQCADLIQFHTDHFGSGDMTVVMTGGLDTGQMLQMICNAFEDWQRQPAPVSRHVPVVARPAHNIRRHVKIDQMSQTDINMGTLGPSRLSPDYLAGILGNSILGQFGMMGRIGAAVREKAGLAYYAGSSLNGYTDLGSWEIEAGVNPANVKKAVDLILKEVSRFRKKPVSAEELEDNQLNFVSRLPLMMESNQGVAAAVLNMERFQLGLDYYREYPAKVRAITAEQIQAVAERYLAEDGWVIASAGVA